MLQITLDPKTYPTLEAPNVWVKEGFWTNKSYTIVSRLSERFQVGFPVLYDWYAYCQNELFLKDDGSLDSVFFPNGKILSDKTRTDILKYELYETAIIKASINGIVCPVCCDSVTSLDKIHILKECLHAYCKNCLKEDVS